MKRKKEQKNKKKNNKKTSHQHLYNNSTYMQACIHTHTHKHDGHIFDFSSLYENVFVFCCCCCCCRKSMVTIRSFNAHIQINTHWNCILTQFNCLLPYTTPFLFVSFLFTLFLKHFLIHIISFFFFACWFATHIHIRHWQF